LTTLINAHVVDIRVDAEHSQVTEVVVRTLNGREGRIAADVFVLACGGIETPRLLLNANTQVRHGLGNGKDIVGRFFMDHPHFSVPNLTVQDESLFKGWLQRGSYDDHQQFLFCVGLAAQKQKDMQILNARAHVYRTPSMNKDELSKVGIFLEQAPNPKSRIVLANSVDALGSRRVRLDWQINELDWKTYEQTASILSEEFQRSGASPARSSHFQPDRTCTSILHTGHQLGTTRMSETSADGVVDPNCRVHGLSNLYILGGSTFPTGGWANPTFTVMALAHRLADYLRPELK
jgi:choline dehydrogenase-like flavoprotein